MKRFASIILMIFLIVPLAAHASALSVTPEIIDLKGQARDIIRKSITLNNPTGQMLSVYASVNNISGFNQKEKFIDPSLADQSSSLANWIQITRGVIQLAPHATQDIPLEVGVNVQA